MSAHGGDFTSEDLALFRHLRAGNAWLRALLATLARRGVAFRRDHPERARAWLDELAVFPYYKAGQFLFDLLEWEDFVLDEPAETLPTALDLEAVRRLSDALGSVQAHLDGAVPLEPAQRPPFLVTLADETELPPLEGGFYLYQDVVLGVLHSVLPAFREQPNAE